MKGSGVNDSFHLGIGNMDGGYPAMIFHHLLLTYFPFFPTIKIEHTYICRNFL